MPHLDRYDGRIVDDEEYDLMSIEDRLAAESELRRQDRERGIFRRDDRELFYDESDDDADPRRKRRMAEKAAAGETEDAEMIESIENLEDTKGHTIKEWVCMIGPRTEIANRFKNFLRTYTSSRGQHVFQEKIRRMCESNKVKQKFK
jgi:DNA replication licensing factor MCM2